MIAKRRANKRLSSHRGRASSSDPPPRFHGWQAVQTGRRRENLNFLPRASRTPHNDAPSPHAGPFRAIRRLATQGDCLASTSQRVSGRDRGACTRWPPIRISSRESAAESAPRNPPEADATDQRASCTAEVRPIPPHARPSGSLGDERDGAAVVPSRPIASRSRSPFPCVSRRRRDPHRARKHGCHPRPAR